MQVSKLFVKGKIMEKKEKKKKEKEKENKKRREKKNKPAHLTNQWPKELYSDALSSYQLQIPAFILGSAL